MHHQAAATDYKPSRNRAAPALAADQLQSLNVIGVRTRQVPILPADSALPRIGSSGQPTACRSAGSVRERGRCSSRHVRIAVRRGGHLILEALLLAAPAREMDGDVGGYLDRLRQDLHDLAVHLLLLRGRQFEISRDGR